MKIADKSCEAGVIIPLKKPVFALHVVFQGVSFARTLRVDHSWPISSSKFVFFIIKMGGITHNSIERLLFAIYPEHWQEKDLANFGFPFPAFQIFREILLFLGKCLANFSPAS